MCRFPCYIHVHVVLWNLLLTLFPAILTKLNAPACSLQYSKAWIFHVGGERALHPLSITFSLSVLKPVTSEINFIPGTWSRNNIRTGQNTAADLPMTWDEKRGFVHSLSHICGCCVRFAVNRSLPEEVWSTVCPLGQTLAPHSTPAALKRLNWRELSETQLDGFSAFCCNCVPVVLSEINSSWELASTGRSRILQPKYFICTTRLELLKMRAGLFSPFLFHPGQGQVKINYNQLLRLLCIWWRLKGVVWIRPGLAEVQFYLFHSLPLSLV